MNVKDFLKTVEARQIADKYIQHRNYMELHNYNIENIEAAVKKVTDSLNNLSTNETHDWILIPSKYIDDGVERYQAALYKTYDVKDFKSSMSIDEWQNAIKQVDTIDIENISSLVTNNSIDTYAYSFEDWNDIASFDIYIPTDKTNNLDFKAEVAEDIFWELTFHGIDNKDRQNRIEEIKQLLDKAEKDIEEGRVYTIDDIREKFGLYDKRTPAEKEQSIRSIYKENLINMFYAEQALLQYQEEFLD